MKTFADGGVIPSNPGGYSFVGQHSCILTAEILGQQVVHIPIASHPVEVVRVTVDGTSPCLLKKLPKYLIAKILSSSSAPVDGRASKPHDQSQEKTEE